MVDRLLANAVNAAWSDHDDHIRDRVCDDDVFHDVWQNDAPPSRQSSDRDPPGALCEKRNKPSRIRGAAAPLANVTQETTAQRRDKDRPMILPHTLKRITLHLARSKEFPSGSDRHGYDLVAPLDGEGHIDPQLWQEYRTYCRVRRFWNGAEEQVGRLVHKPGGAEHARWIFDYAAEQSDDDEAGYRFGAHRFLPGEYVSIADSKGGLHTFRVAAVKPAT